MIASKAIETLIRNDKDGRFVLRGTTKGQIAGYPSDTVFEIWDDLRDQKTYHVAKLTASK